MDCVRCLENPLLRSEGKGVAGGAQWAVSMGAGGEAKGGPGDGAGLDP